MTGHKAGGMWWAGRRPGKLCVQLEEGKRKAKWEQQTAYGALQDPLIRAVDDFHAPWQKVWTTNLRLDANNHKQLTSARVPKQVP